MALPDGYQTMLGERGVTLSGEQRQRICLARAIIKRPAMLIPDEPTSAVDAESEAVIWEAIRRLQQGKTILVIAHQFSSIRRFDQILVLKRGQVVERGTHFELLDRHGYYQRQPLSRAILLTVSGLPATTHTGEGTRQLIQSPDDLCSALADRRELA